MIFRYPGGKTKAKNRIFQRFPKTFREYREPCVGGGSIYFHVDTRLKRWINDINPHLISVYVALRDRSEDFIAQCREIEPAKPGESVTATRTGGKEKYNARLKEVFDRMISESNVDPALKFYFINRTVWMGRVNYKLPSRLYYSNPQGWDVVNSTKLERAGRILQDTIITVGDYKVLLETDGTDVLIYLDPPYVINSDFDPNSQLYEDNFTEQDHKDMAEAIKDCKHKVILSYDDDEDGLIRELYDDFYIFEESWKYVGTSSAKGTHSPEKRDGQELIITNYQPDRSTFIANSLF
jgi:DNA adenine methylase